MPRSRVCAARFGRSSAQSAALNSTSIMSTTGPSGSIYGSYWQLSVQFSWMAMRTNRIDFLDLQFDRLSFQDVEDWLKAASSETPYAYIVTPNVDHLVRAHGQPELRKLYEAADICVCDSRILKMLARLRGLKLPLVPGSDLTEALFSDVIEAGDRIAVVGADRDCLGQLEAKRTGTHFLHFDPPFGLRS